MRFVDRRQAGRELARRLAAWADEGVVVVGLARGGVPVAAEVAQALRAPLLALTPRKIGHPLQPEYALAAVCGDGPVVLGEGPSGAMDASAWEAAVAEARRTSLQRAARYQALSAAVALDERTVVVIDDGVATGLTLLAAIEALRRAGARRVVVGVPVAPASTLRHLAAAADAAEAVWVPEPFPGAVGMAYERFEQVSDAEVERVLRDARRRWEARSRAEQAAP